jgi:hypothetical protein
VDQTFDRLLVPGNGHAVSSRCLDVDCIGKGGTSRTAAPVKAGARRHQRSTLGDGTPNQARTPLALCLMKLSQLKRSLKGKPRGCGPYPRGLPRLSAVIQPYTP